MQKPKIKWGKGQLIAGVVILMVLVSGLMAGILLSQHNQNVPKSEAAGGWCNAPAAGTDFGSPCNPNGATDCGGDGVETTCTNNTWHATGNCCGLAPTPPGGGGQTMCTNTPSSPVASFKKFVCPSGCAKDTDGIWRCNLNEQDSTAPLTLNGACGQVDEIDGAGAFCGTLEYTCGETRCQPAPQPTPTPVPSTTPVPTPTNTPIPTPTHTPTPTPSRTPTPTPSRTPTPSPTLPPGITPTVTPIPTPTGVAACQQVTVLSIVRAGTAIASPTLAKIQKGDVVTFRGFATATNAVVSTIDFTLIKAGVTQPVVHKTPTLVAGVYQADNIITIDQATSYSMNSAPTYQ